MFRLRLVKDDTDINFMGMGKPLLASSTLLMAVAVAMIFLKGLNLGIDFTGGVLMEIRPPAEMKIGDVRGALSGLSAGTPVIQEFGEDGIMIKIPGREADQAAQKALYAEVQELLGGQVEYRRVEYVGPQVGHELIMAGVKAFIYSMIGILAYIWIRFEWQFGVVGLYAVAHDVLLTVLFFILTGIEFDLSTVAAVLLVAGYSINDTVIVFDRIRELMRKYRKMPMRELCNKAVNQTLGRTVITSGSTLLVLGALYAFGTENIRGFTLALIVGIGIGTYSSVFVAAAQLLYLNLRPAAATPQGAGEPAEQE